MQEIIYFDNNATTRLDERVLESMLPYLLSEYGNPASQHRFGLNINKKVEDARHTIANFINCASEEVIFTSGATESINLALKGVAFNASGNKNKIVTVTTEHKAVLDTCAYLEQVGFDIVYVPVDSAGLIDIVGLQDAIDINTIAVCVMFANNETGVVQPIKMISEVCHTKRVLLICDATQAVGKVIVDVKDLGVDMLIFSGHKFHGPKGIGALFIRKGIRLSPIIHGGSHEKTLRSGTLNSPAIIGLASACLIASAEMASNAHSIFCLRNKLEQSLLTRPGTKLNGDPVLRLHNVTNITFPDTDANTLISGLPYLAISNGSACTSSVFEPSYVLTAMGVSRSDAYGAIRFSLSKYNTSDEVDRTVRILFDYLDHSIQNF